MITISLCRFKNRRLMKKKTHHRIRTRNYEKNNSKPRHEEWRQPREGGWEKQHTQWNWKSDQEKRDLRFRTLNGEKRSWTRPASKPPQNRYEQGKARALDRGPKGPRHRAPTDTRTRTRSRTHAHTRPHHTPTGSNPPRRARDKRVAWKRSCNVRSTRLE